MTDRNADLIVARATPPGAGAVAIVKLDGAGAAGLVRELFHPAGEVAPCDSPRMMIFGAWRNPDSAEIIDQGMAAFFAGPASYTGNDVAEFHCHGGRLPAQRLIEAAQARGARLAEPGEFTRRAYLNGKLDLAQAEAVADLINAQTEAAARLAGRQLAGALSRKLEAIREQLITLAAEIEARIDFPEEDLGEADRRRLGGMFAASVDQINELLATRRRGRLLREGARIALVGRPNAGKSSLLNALARSERAIVTPHAGTTRDTIECTIDLAGIPATLVDTAGLRESQDPIEQIGIERARREIEQADLVVLVRDIAAEMDMSRLAETLADGDPEQFALEALLGARRPELIVMNKIDLIGADATHPLETSRPAEGRLIHVSALHCAGIAELEQALAALLEGGTDSSASGELSVNLRHGELLDKSATSLRAARQAFDQGLSGEFVMVDMREALDALGAILGIETGDVILDRIFSSFCIGK